MDKFVSLFKKNRKKILILLLILLIPLYFVLRPSTEDEKELMVVEPDVPISEEVLSEKVTNLDVENEEFVETDEETLEQPNQASNSGTGNINVDEDVALETPQKTIDDLGTIRKYTFSDNGESVLILSDSPLSQTYSHNSNKEFSLVSKVSAQENIDIGFELSIASKTGVIIDSIEEAGVTDAEFINDITLYYQILGPKNGVYEYEIETKVTKNMVFTYDPRTFSNIVPTTVNDYFYIQQNTGRIGFGQVDTGETSILDEKILETQSNYVKSGAYRFVTQAPDMAKLAIYDISGNEDSAQVKVLIFSPSIKSLDEALKVTVNYPAGGFASLNDVFAWSQDSKYLVAGSESKIINAQTGEVVKEHPTGTRVRINNSTSKYLSLDINNLLQIRSFENNEGQDVNYVVSQAEWLDDEIVLLVIGEGLYVYNTSTEELRAVNEIKAHYSIIEAPGNGEAWVLNDDEVIKISNK